MPKDERIAQLEEALGVAVCALRILADWHAGDIQLNPPKEWELEAYEESSTDGWCNVTSLAHKFKELLESKTVQPELQPCPFCGSDDLHIVDECNRNDVPFYNVMCFSCDSAGAAFNDADRAKTAWNRREWTK